MKPSFALDFRDGAIALLHRTSRGWQQVGAVALDAPDLTEALAYMRSTALGLSPRGLSTKLVLPNDQILLTTVHAPGPDAARRRKQIKAALEGLTPYPVDDLAFDWSGNGSEVRVAVVARETLAEAEAFAAEHRFNPVSFVAAPEDATFQGEPHFGPTALSETLLAPGEKVERDQDAIIVVTRDLGRPEKAAVAAAEVPAAEPPVQPAPPAAAEAPAQEVKAEPAAEAAEPPAAPAAQPAELAAAPFVAAPDPAPATEAEPASLAPLPSATQAAPAAQPDGPAPQAPVTGPAANPAVPPTAPPAVQPREDGVLPDFTAAKVPPAGPSSFDMKAIAVDLVDEAPIALDVAAEGKDPAPPAPEAPRPEAAPSAADLPPPPSPAPSILAAFSSRRGAEPLASGQPDAAPTDFAKAAAAARARKAPAVGPAPAQRPSVPRPGLAKPAAASPAGRDMLPFPGRGPAKTAAVKPGVAGQAKPDLKSDRTVVPMAKAAAATSPDAAARSGAQKGAQKAAGLFGGPAPVRGKPRYLGLVLTALLLLALALVAAWSSFSLSQTEADPGSVPADTGLAATDPALGQTDLPTAEDEALADGQDLEPLDATATAEAAPDPQEPQGTVAEPAPQTGLTGETLAVTAVPGNAPQDEIFLAANDTTPAISDPVLLPTLAAATDPPPQLGAPPPPFGTVYSFDANGRIEPTPEGIITPEGVLLVEGRPKQVPPARPSSLTQATVEPVEPVLAAAPTTNSTLDTFEADPALAGKKPRSRPEGLVAQPLPDQQGGAATPAPGSRFADIRPQIRPAALTQPSPQAEGAAAASLAAAGLEPGNALSLVSSRKPLARPDGMDQAVDAAVAAALQSAETEPQAGTETASLAPEEQEEPEVDNPAPDIPTSASVAKQATDKDALNLSRLALIGIFGNSAGRYAMIRQPNGGIKRVKVGDQIDGGRVAAITATELQYQKGGRIVTLTLPKG